MFSYAGCTTLPEIKVIIGSKLEYKCKCWKWKTG